MRKIITTITILLCLLVSASAFSQSSQKANFQDSVALWNKHLDSALSKTSIKDFQQWLYENATVKQYQEGKFVDLLNAYVQREYQVWIQPKSSPKK